MKTKYFKYVKSIALIIFGAMLFSCENDLTVVESLKVDENTPVQSSSNIDMEYSDSGLVMMRLRSPELHRYISDKEYIEMPKGIDVVFFDSIGNTKSTLRSNYAINHVEKKIIEARINVIATNVKGEKLYTEELIWDQKKHKIYTEKQVKVVSEKTVLFGDGLIADENFIDWEIQNPHDAEFLFDE